MILSCDGLSDDKQEKEKDLLLLLILRPGIDLACCVRAT
mgnify:FL=1